MALDLLSPSHLSYPEKNMKKPYLFGSHLPFWRATMVDAPSLPWTKVRFTMSFSESMISGADDLGQEIVGTWMWDWQWMVSFLCTEKVRERYACPGVSWGSYGPFNSLVHNEHNCSDHKLGVPAGSGFILVTWIFRNHNSICMDHNSI